MQQKIMKKTVTHSTQFLLFKINSSSITSKLTRAPLTWIMALRKTKTTNQVSNLNQSALINVLLKLVRLKLSAAETLTAETRVVETLRLFVRIPCCNKCGLLV
jgi:hypothetical protein